MDAWRAFPEFSRDQHEAILNSQILQFLHENMIPVELFDLIPPEEVNLIDVVTYSDSYYLIKQDQDYLLLSRKYLAKPVAHYFALLLHVAFKMKERTLESPLYCRFASNN